MFTKRFRISDFVLLILKSFPRAWNLTLAELEPRILLPLFRAKNQPCPVQEKKLYQKLQLEYGDAYTTIKHGTVQKEVKELWVKLKSGSGNNEDPSQACVWEFEKGSTKTEIFTFE